MKRDAFDTSKMSFLRFRFLIALMMCLIHMGNLFAWRMYWSTTGNGGVSEGVDLITEGDPITSSGSFGGLTDLTIGQAVTGKLRETYDIDNLGFWYKSKPALLDFSISADTWDIDSIFSMETTTMSGRDRFVIYNNGNFYLDLGLSFNGSEHGGWRIGRLPGNDVVTIRAKFTGDDREPTIYDYILDCIETDVKWSGYGSFGDYGKAIPSGRPVKLWLQFLAPTHSSHWGENTVYLTLHGQYHLP